MTTFQDQYENAAVMIDACRDEFSRAGMEYACAQLKGLELTNPSSVQEAIVTLGSIHAHGVAEEVRRAAMDVLCGSLPKRAPLAS